jgi:hypothetical protein
MKLHGSSYQVIERTPFGQSLVQQVADNAQRYNDFKVKHSALEPTPPGNNFPWKWKQPDPLEV